MEKNYYNPQEIEPKILEFWEKEKIFKWDPKKKGKIFSIDTPPPTVSGKMHIGHAFNYTSFDVIARFKKMQGFNLFFPFGTDDNGLATERLIEKLKGIRAKEIGRDRFIDICLKTLKEITPEFIADWKRIGMSCDFELFYSTINTHCRAISQKSFIQLYKAGREYRKEAPTIWCPECQTAIAQVELKDKQFESTFNDIIFKVGNENIIISTTRPELLPSCVAIFYHPSDERYRHLKGKKAKVPLFNFEVPILEDENVDIAKGTGIVMCCTFGDITDIEWWRKHNLPLKISINKEGKMIVKGYEGLSINEARKKIIEDLKLAGLLVGQKKIMHIVNVHERCDTPIEFLVTKQWFIRYLDLKEIFLKLGKQLRWHPEFMRVRYENWIRGLKWDWCISRQRYFGVPFPVWYCKNCDNEILANEDELPVDPLIDKPPVKECPKCKSKEFFPETDVLDTWATSSLTPIIAIELVNKKLHKKLFPMDLRPQGQDIVTFWLFNTVVKSWLHYKKLPWRNAMITGYVLSSEGEKMSKSKGNIIEPQELIKKYCADSLRYWASSVKLGEDLNVDEKEFIAGQRLLTKLWNAAKFFNFASDKKPKSINKIDYWLFLKLNELIDECTKAYENYDVSKARSLLLNFFWHTFCDDWLEIAKNRIYKQDNSACFTLYFALSTIVKLFSPILPFITEEIYQLYMKKIEKKKSINFCSWPKKIKLKKDKTIIFNGEKFIEILHKVRSVKADAKKSLKAEIILSLESKDFEILKDYIDDLKAVTNAKEIIKDKFNVKFL
ncbi:MAG: valine--tRNA ligase [Candidatus Pacearchaeota archaeon]